jgi:hypothetical protein
MKIDATIADLSAWLTSTCSLRPEHSSSLASALLDIKKDAGFDELKETLLHDRGSVDQALRVIKWSAARIQGRNKICDAHLTRAYYRYSLSALGHLHQHHILYRCSHVWDAQESEVWRIGSFVMYGHLY